MKMNYTTANGRLRFELDATDGKQAFEIVARIQEIFEVPCCGRCRSTEIKHDVREYDGNKYYKMVCQTCRAQLDFGQHKTGNGLFLKRKDKDGNWIPDGGWYIWGDADAGTETPAAPVARPTAPPAAPSRQPAPAPPPPPPAAGNNSPIPF